MAGESTRLYRAVVVAGVSLTACTGAPAAVQPTPERAAPPVNDAPSAGAPAQAELRPSEPAPAEPRPDEPAQAAGSPDRAEPPPPATTPADPQADADAEVAKPARKKETAAERKKRERDLKFPLIL